MSTQRFYGCWANGMPFAQHLLEAHIKASRDAVRQITLHGLFEARDAIRTGAA